MTGRWYGFPTPRYRGYVIQIDGHGRDKTRDIEPTRHVDEARQGEQAQRPGDQVGDFIERATGQDAERNPAVSRVECQRHRGQQDRNRPQPDQIPSAQPHPTMLRNPVDHTARQAHTKALAAAEPGELSVTTSRPAGGTHVLDKLFVFFFFGGGGGGKVSKVTAQLTGIARRDDNGEPGPRDPASTRPGRRSSGRLSDRPSAAAGIGHPAAAERGITGYG